MNAYARPLTRLWWRITNWTGSARIRLLDFLWEPLV